MTAAVLAAVGSAMVWSQVDPGTDLLRSGYAQLGAVAILLAFGWWEIRQANKRTDAEREQRIAEVAQERARTEQERAERKESEARERRQAEVVLPALQEANRALDSVNRMVERGQSRT